jgi:hypothetical protein
MVTTIACDDGLLISGDLPDRQSFRLGQQSHLCLGCESSPYDCICRILWIDRKLGLVFAGDGECHRFLLIFYFGGTRSRGCTAATFLISHTSNRSNLTGPFRAIQSCPWISSRCPHRTSHFRNPLPLPSLSEEHCTFWNQWN